MKNLWMVNRVFHSNLSQNQKYYFEIWKMTPAKGSNASLKKKKTQQIWVFNRSKTNSDI